MKELITCMYMFDCVCMHMYMCYHQVTVCAQTCTHAHTHTHSSYMTVIGVHEFHGQCISIKVM